MTEQQTSEAVTTYLVADAARGDYRKEAGSWL